MAYVDEEGRKGIRVQFYLQGLRKRATAQIDAREVCFLKDSTACQLAVPIPGTSCCCFYFSLVLGVFELLTFS
jgi:hypothetical protein